MSKDKQTIDYTFPQFTIYTLLKNFKPNLPCSNLLLLKSGGVFKNDLLSEAIFLLRQLVLKHELGSDATYRTCDFTTRVRCVSEKHGFEKKLGFKLENILEIFWSYAGENKMRGYKMLREEIRHQKL